MNPEGCTHNPASQHYAQHLQPLCGIEADGCYVWILASNFKRVTVGQVEAVEDWVYHLAASGGSTSTSLPALAS